MRHDDLIINEYHNGEFNNDWDNLDECAKFHNTHPAMIKALIFNGTPLPYCGKPIITFDLDPECNMEIELTKNPTNRKKYRIVTKKSH